MIGQTRSLIAVSLLSLALAACNDSNAKTDTPAAATTQPRAVVVETIKFAPQTVDRSFVGTVRPRVESDLGFRVTGKVAERLVQQGQRVTRGQTLARLDTVDLQLQKQQADAELAAAMVNLTTSEAQDKRTIDLRSAGWATQATLDQQLAKTADARGRVDKARRALELAINQLAYTSLVSDADGIVTATMAEPGQVVAAGTPVVRLALASDREAVVAIPETFLERVRTGQASVSLWSNQTKRYDAVLREFAASADTATRTFQARFTIKDADDGVVIGMTATVTVGEPASARVARLPISALYAEGRGPSVFVVDAATGQLTLKPVTVAGYDGREVIIAGGVEDGDKVVALGVHKLDASQRVRIVDSR
ncbi:efflux RND transporter periplasmic adaptor subunit [Phreatobacter aquaticus]|uniref:Efflux RND transporter periplasmic adaptor subunit n=1 Tax=Phreatobacter aquaticus TaxID=2570229 RepID=A0A4D7QFP2_9HYPH|nr:efflux RND transporter periplasmic adaptor subunit [Phreatobacter aquaticus]QCK84619.1 efflux RND transporter periplasmic adaptor subunit [Phreatobacter aquaticus]